MIMTKGIVLGHFMSNGRIQVDLKNIEVILTLPIPQIQNYAIIFLSHVPIIVEDSYNILAKL
jgi:hypothetical protein